MKLFRAAATAISIIALFALAAPAAMADDLNRETVVTINGPIEVPGVGEHILPAGTYVFKILDSPSDRHIVQIFSQDKTHLYTTILAIPNFRLKATNKTVITFSERPAGEPEALRAWFYPGREWGEEFVYPPSKAVLLAKEANVTVLTTSTEMESAPIETLKTVPVVAVAPTGESVALNQAVDMPPAEADVAPAAAAAPVMVAAETLPKTASLLPLIGLLGMLGLAGSIVLSFTARRVLKTKQ
jgi:hypothetical protein